MPTDRSPLGFTAAWYTLGVVTPARVVELEQIWAHSDDKNVEHYRWRAFKDFLQHRRPLSPQVALALYELGATDADIGMGESMMHEVAALPECPLVVLERARASGRKHLIKAATRQPGSDAI
jgi:hypothetical protein